MNMEDQQLQQQLNAGMKSHVTGSSNGEIKTLWIGDLQPWVDENHLYTWFGYPGEIQFVEVIRDRLTGYSKGYAFLHFVTHEAALKCLQTYNGTQMPCTQQVLRMNWSFYGSAGERKREYSLFVGDLAPDVTESLLKDTFRSRYNSVSTARVITDVNTGRSKGYGFVKFFDENEKNRAMTEMNGVYCSTRPMRTGVATRKISSLQHTAIASTIAPAFQNSQMDPNQYWYGHGYQTSGNYVSQIPVGTYGYNGYVSLPPNPPIYDNNDNSNHGYGNFEQ